MLSGSKIEDQNNQLDEDDGLDLIRIRIIQANGGDTSAIANRLNARNMSTLERVQTRFNNRVLSEANISLTPQPEFKAIGLPAFFQFKKIDKYTPWGNFWRISLSGAILGLVVGLGLVLPFVGVVIFAMLSLSLTGKASNLIGSLGFIQLLGVLALFLNFAFPPVLIGMAAIVAASLVVGLIVGAVKGIQAVSDSPELVLDPDTDAVAYSNNEATNLLDNTPSIPFSPPIEPSNTTENQAVQSTLSAGTDVEENEVQQDQAPMSPSF
jgi:hypothetical protein